MLEGWVLKQTFIAVCMTVCAILSCAGPRKLGNSAYVFACVCNVQRIKSWQIFFFFLSTYISLIHVYSSAPKRAASPSKSCQR